MFAVDPTVTCDNWMHEHNSLQQARACAAQQDRQNAMSTTQRPVNANPVANRTIPAGATVRVFTTQAIYVGTLASIWLATDFATTPKYTPMIALDVPSQDARISFPATDVLTVEIFES